MAARYGNPVVAVLTHQTLLAARGNASPLESAYLDCGGHLPFMPSEAIRREQQLRSRCVRQDRQPSDDRTYVYSQTDTRPVTPGAPDATT